MIGTLPRHCLIFFFFFFLKVIALLAAQNKLQMHPDSAKTNYLVSLLQVVLADTFHYDDMP